MNETETPNSIPCGLTAIETISHIRLNFGYKDRNGHDKDIFVHAYHYSDPPVKSIVHITNGEDMSNYPSPLSLEDSPAETLMDLLTSLWKIRMISQDQAQELYTKICNRLQPDYDLH